MKTGTTRLRKTPQFFFAALAIILSCTWPALSYSSDTVVSAVRINDISRSQELVKSGADVNHPEPDGTTPLLWAVYNSSEELVDLLLDAGADPNMANALDITPLLLASRYGNANMIKSLLASGAMLKQPNLASEPVLMSAARAGSVDAVKAILNAGADPDETEPLDNQTALMWATAEGHYDVTETLLEAGANPNIQARINTLTERKNADFPTGGFTALHWAARDGNEPLINLLLENGADINAKNGDKASPMMLAVINDHLDIAADLLNKGADANDGTLYYATIMHDATTDWRAMDGTLFRADHPNKLSALDLTRILLEAGADPNKPFIGQMHSESMCCDTKSKETPLYRAAKAADIDSIKMMLAHGGDPNWKPESEEKYVTIGVYEDIASKSALMVATTGGKGVGVAGGPNDLRNGPPPFREEGNRDPAEAVRLLLEAGADVSIIGPNNETALHVAAKALDPAIVRSLVEHGADLNAENEKGETPLQVVENMERPEPTPGFYFDAPPAWPEDIIALLNELATNQN